MSSGRWEKTLSVEAGRWCISFDVLPGESCTLSAYSGDKFLARFSSSQDLLAWTVTPVDIVLRCDEDETGSVKVSVQPLKLSKHVVAIIRRIKEWPRASSLALIKQLGSGVIAIPHDRVDWAQKSTVIKAEFDVKLANEVILSDQAEDRIQRAFENSSAQVITWDIAESTDGLLPPPSPYLHESLPYTWRSIAFRKGTCPSSLTSLAPGKWVHLHETLSRQKRRTRLVPSSMAQPRSHDSTTSVIIPTRNQPALLQACLDGLARSEPPPAQIVLVDHLTEDPEARKILATAKAQGAAYVRADGKFNFSRLCNLGALLAHQKHLVFLNNDVTPIRSDWLAYLESALHSERIGVVGAELRYPNGRLQHVGIVNSPDGGPVHVNHRRLARDRGPLKLLDYPREYLAVSGACFATTNELFGQLNGFDEDYPEDFNDVDYCLRARELGKLTVLDPRALMTHHESFTRSARSIQAIERREQSLKQLRDRHRILYEADPYFSPLWQLSPPIYRRARWDC